MKIVDKLIGKIGNDKALHFLVGALLTSYASMVNDVCMWVTTVLVVIASLCKEGLDDKYDTKDIIAGCIGAATSIAVYYLTS
jgi:hypothetical protein